MALRDTQAELRRVSDQLDAARRRRDHNRRQADAAKTAIEQLGPIGRRLHRRQLHEQQTRHTTATTNLERANDHIDHLTARHKQLDAEHDRLTAQLKRLTAERERQATELAARAARADPRPGISDPTIDLHALLEAAFRAGDRATNRPPDHEPDTAMDLGL